MKKLLIIVSGFLLLAGCSQLFQNTYHNDKYGFSLTYPKDWDLKEQSTGKMTDGYPDLFWIELVSPERKKMLSEPCFCYIASGDAYVDVYQSASVLPNNYKNLGLEKWLEEEVSTLEFKDVERTTFANFPAFKALEFDGKWQPVTYVEHKGRIYKIFQMKDGLIYDPKANAQLEAQAEKIIQSFQFADSDATLPQTNPAPQTLQFTQQPTQTTQSPHLQGDFHFVGAQADYEGSLYVKGYARKEVRDEGFCDTNCKKYTYVFFEALPELDGGKKVFQDFLASWKGNSFVDGKAVSIGCVENGKIDNFNQQDSTKVLASTKDQPVVLRMERGPLPIVARDAPDCYSLFHDFKVQK